MVSGYIWNERSSRVMRAVGVKFGKNTESSRMGY